MFELRRLAVVQVDGRLGDVLLILWSSSLHSLPLSLALALSSGTTCGIGLNPLSRKGVAGVASVLPARFGGGESNVDVYVDVVLHVSYLPKGVADVASRVSSPAAAPSC